MAEIRIMQGNIVEQNVDAIVNAANNSLLGGGGVDGAIHRVAGPALLEECKRLGGCETGKAKITSGHLLPAKFIIHTVGPIWSGGNCGEPDLLRSCYRNCLELAAHYKLVSIAFPSISTGAFGYPIKEASFIALEETSHFMRNTDNPIQLIFFICFNAADLHTYEETWSRMCKSG
ncbi:O-acetyl-ADP-ribose deacetylase [bacterium]|nr:MAG: O-acetyl-ADP-ribose deacetylase [bacterium]